MEFESLIAARNTRGDAAVAPESDTLLAFILSRVAADEAEILTVVTSQSAQRKGLASQLLTEHLNTLRHAGVGRIFLEVAADNGAAQKLYRNFGFEKIAERPSYYANTAGESTAAHVMGLNL